MTPVPKTEPRPGRAGSSGGVRPAVSAGAAMLLVDPRAGRVVRANDHALAIADDVRFPFTAVDWATRVGLRETSGTTDDGVRVAAVLAAALPARDDAHGPAGSARAALAPPAPAPAPAPAGSRPTASDPAAPRPALPDPDAPRSDADVDPGPREGAPVAASTPGGPVVDEVLLERLRRLDGTEPFHGHPVAVHPRRGGVGEEEPAVLWVVPVDDGEGPRTLLVLLPARSTRGPGPAAAPRSDGRGGGAPAATAALRVGGTADPLADEAGGLGPAPDATELARRLGPAAAGADGAGADLAGAGSAGADGGPDARRDAAPVPDALPGGVAAPDPEASAVDRQAVVATSVSFTISDPHLPDQPLVFVNPAFTAVTGYTAEQSIGRNCRFLQGPGTDRAAVARIGAALAAQRGIVETLLNYRADGTPFYNEVAISPMLDESGRTTHFVGVQSDVTVRVLLENERERALAVELQARAGLEVLTAVADALAQLETLDGVQEVVDTVLAADAVGWSAQWVGCHLLGERPRLVLAARTPDGARTRKAFHEPPSAPVGGPVSAMLTGQLQDPVRTAAAEVGGAPTSAAGRWLAEQLGADAPGDCTVVPLVGRDGVLGLLALGAPEPGVDHLSLLVDIGRRMGTAADDVRAHRREHDLAETLQRSMLPEHVFVTGLDTWSYYAPGSQHAQIGGDWYDVLPFDDGAVGVVIGDVVGHDVEAAAAMGQLRSVVRAYAFDHDDPAGVVGRVDQLLLGMRIGRPASLVYGRLDRLDDPPAEERTGDGPSADEPPAEERSGDGPSAHAPPLDAPSADEPPLDEPPAAEGAAAGGGPDGGDDGHRWSFRWTRAGHLPPVLVRAATGRAELLDHHGGLLVGVSARERTSSEVVLEPGDLLVLVTDGLVERRHRSMLDGVQLLLRVCEQLAPSDAAGAGEQLLAALADDPEDDIAVVLVRVPRNGEPGAEPVGTTRQRRWQLASHPSSIARARRHAAGACRVWGLGVGAHVELVVSELVSNAVLHSWGTVGLRLVLEEHQVVVEVADANPHPPVAQTSPPPMPGTGGYGMKVVERLGGWGWRRSGPGKTVWARIART